MSFYDSYRPAEYGVTIPEGENKIRIKEVFPNEQSRNTGARMIKIVLEISGVPNITVNHFLVEGEYFDTNATKFFDAFGITRGDFNFGNWYGAQAVGFFERGEKNAEGKSYVELKYLVVKKDQNRQNRSQTAQPASTASQRHAAPPQSYAPPPNYQQRQSAQNQQYHGYNQQIPADEDIPF